MKETLQIHHIAKRLPYGLKVKTIYGIFDVCGWSDEIGILLDTILYGANAIPKYKLVLFPLSCLTESITVNGETFVPAEIINQIYSRHEIEVYKYMDYPLELNITTEDFSQDVDLFSGVLIYEFLLKNHFDVDGLIEKGLAISVLDLDKNPYA